MQNLSQNEPEKIAKIRHIKNYKKMSKEGLLIALLKSKQSHAELYKSKSNNAEIEETQKIFNKIRRKTKKPWIKKVRKDLCEKDKGLESENEKEKKQHAEELRGGGKHKNLSPEVYLDIIRPLRDMINTIMAYGEWKIQLTMQITFISSLDTGEFRIMHSKSDNIEIMMGIEIDDIINELFESF